MDSQPKNSDNVEKQVAPTPHAEGYMTSRQVMDHLHVSRTKLWKLVKTEGLPAYQFGLKGDYRYKLSEVEAWAKKQRLDSSLPHDAD